jgi:hypothetical protein
MSYKDIKKYFLLSTIIGGTLFASGCEDAEQTVNKVANDVAEQVQSEASKDNPFVLSVKNGHLQSYPDKTIGEAFSTFFSSPTWKYFQSETGENVVEFTGYCMYMEQKVKAKMQFIVNENSDSFQIGALGFNDVPQNELTKAGLLQAIYENKNNETANEATNVEAAVPKKETQQSKSQNNNQQLIEQVKNSHILEIKRDTIGNIFDGDLFSNSSWKVKNGEVVFKGSYRGQIVEGEPANLEFTFTPNGDGSYYVIKTVKYNGELAAEEGASSIIQMIDDATQ